MCHAKKREMKMAIILCIIVEILVFNTPNKCRNTQPFVWKQRLVCVYFATQFIQKKGRLCHFS